MFLHVDGNLILNKNVLDQRKTKYDILSGDNPVAGAMEQPTVWEEETRGSRFSVTTIQALDAQAISVRMRMRRRQRILGWTLARRRIEIFWIQTPQQ